MYVFLVLQVQGIAELTINVIIYWVYPLASNSG